MQKGGLLLSQNTVTSLNEQPKTCCIYFSIETGCYLIFTLTIIDLFIQASLMIFESLWAEYVPVFILNLIFVLMFAYPWYNRSKNSKQYRKRTALYYLICIAIACRLWIIFGLTGVGVDEAETICNKHELANDWYNGNEITCHKAVKTTLIVTVIINMAIQLYYSYVLKLYSEDPDCFDDTSTLRARIMF